MAEHHGLSARTLMRYLKAEGSHYQALLDAELSRQAAAHLMSPRHTVESVALALGYQDVTAFRRAFHRWFGMPPSAWLQQHGRLAGSTTLCAAETQPGGVGLITLSP